MKKVMQKPLSLLLALLIVLSVFTVVPVTVAGAQIVTDVLTASDFAATGTTYTAFSGVRKNTAANYPHVTSDLTFTAQYSESLVKLAKAMLDYGAKAQVMFGINTGVPANKDITDYTMANVTVGMIEAAIGAANGSLTTSDMRANTGSFGLEYYGSSVVYLTETTLRHYYTIKDEGLYDSVKNNTTFTLDERKLPYVMFDMSDIAANPEPPRDPYEDIIF
ncbi:hypothetical protein [Ruminococcus sp.]|uniref:hypothetical protein n=1 Tax=Ruminococcus sp. TaxID=41978 RepID=UPI00388DE7A3